MKKSKILRILRNLGPGVVTGASDDDPSGIATYSQAGSSFGYSFLWTAILTYPLMVNMQKMCARIGLVTSNGLAGVVKKEYPKPVLWLLVLFSIPAIILNIGANIAGMGAVAHMLVPGVPAFSFAIVFTILITVLVIRLPYSRIAATLKWLCLVLFCYLFVPFLSKPDWLEVIKGTFIPALRWEKEFLLILVGILGTTISPYLFFWQTSMEVEEKHRRKLVVNKRIIRDMEFDVDLGMFFSNLVFYFIVLTTGSVLFDAGVHSIDTVDEAATALRPLAGELSYALFAIGVIGTGFLSIPVLAGSVSYMVSEAFGWKEGLNKKFHQARGFYLVLILSMAVALFINFTGLNPMHALVYTAVLYGITAPVLIGIILHICNNAKVMKTYTNTRAANIVGTISLLLMTAAALMLIWLQFRD